jgi:HK97 family phage portal protein
MMPTTSAFLFSEGQSMDQPWYNADRVAFKGRVILQEWMERGGAGVERKDATSTRDLYKDILSMASSKSGVKVTWKTALQASTAIACGRVLAEGLAQVPFKLFKELHGGGMEPARQHDTYDLTANKPNEWQTSFELREMMGLHLAFKGGSFIYKVHDQRGRIVELLPFEPQLVTTKRKGWDISYEVRAHDGTIIPVGKENMWHLRGLSWDGVNGLDWIKLAGEAIGLSLAMEEHSSRMFSNGARPSGALVAPGNLKEDQVRLIKETWDAAYGGSANAFKTAVLFGGLDWKPFSMTGVDSQHLEQRRFAVEEVCRYFRVMPIMVGHADKAATYASAEQMFLAHVVHTLMPWYTRIEQSANVNLLTDAERKQGYYFKFIVQALMRGSSKDRADYFAKALGAGGGPAWMTQDEVRELEELNPMGGRAAVLPIPTNVGGTPPKPTEDPENEPTGA